MGYRSGRIMRAAAAAATILATALPAGSASVPPQLTVMSRAPTLASRAQAMDAYLTGLMDSEQFRGAVLVARGTDVLLSKGYGLAVESTSAINTPHTRFRIGSVTKQFTALAVLKLQELGKLKVTDGVCRYVRPCPAAWEPITIEHLLTHTSGLLEYPAFTGDGSVVTTMSPARLLGLFRDQSIRFPPGARVEYSNSGFVLLGYIIERVTGGTYADFLHGEILEPLGLSETGYDANRPSTQTDASGYRDWGHVPAAYSAFDVSTLYAAAGMFSTTTDLYRWNRFLLTGTPPIVTASTLAQLFVQRVLVAPEPSEPEWAGYGMWSAGPVGNVTYVHGGAIPGFLSVNLIRPHQQLSITVLSNYEFATVDFISGQLARIAAP